AKKQMQEQPTSSMLAINTF
ncbi:hypothetical protein D047_0213B, partial [Vibrio parahaemolyticus VPTS-2010_2]